MKFMTIFMLVNFGKSKRLPPSSKYLGNLSPIYHTIPKLVCPPQNPNEIEFLQVLPNKISNICHNYWLMNRKRLFPKIRSESSSQFCFRFHSYGLIVNVGWAYSILINIMLFWKLKSEFLNLSVGLMLAWRTLLLLWSLAWWSSGQQLAWNRPMPMYQLAYSELSN